MQLEDAMDNFIQDKGIEWYEWYVPSIVSQQHQLNN